MKKTSESSQKMSEPSYGMQDSPTTVKHLLIVHGFGALFAILYYFYKVSQQPTAFRKALADATIESTILGACFFATLFIISLMTGNVVTRFGLLSISEARLAVTIAQAGLAGFMLFHLGVVWYLVNIT